MSLEEALALEHDASFAPPTLELSAAASAPTANRTATTTAPVPAATPASVEAGADIIHPSWAERLIAAISGGSIFRKSMLALVDQGVVSAVNFLTTVLLRRSVMGSEEVKDQELGLYFLGFGVVVLAMGVQNALISTPYAVFGDRLPAHERKQFAGSTLLHQTLLSALFTIVLLAAGLGLSFGGNSADMQGMAWMLAAMLPFIMTREFVRRLAFVHLQVVVVLMLDLAVAILQLGGLWALRVTGQLTAVTTFGVIGAACGVAGFAALFLLRDQCSLRQKKTWPDLRQNWSFGKWACAAQLVYLGMAYCPSWMIKFLWGATATGRYAMAMILVMIANPLLIGLNNFLGPQAIHAFHAHGLTALRRFTMRTGLIITAAVSLLFVLLMLTGKTLLMAFYGARVQGQEDVVSILALSTVMYALSISAENGLVALNRPATIFWSNLAGLAVLLSAGFVLINAYGIIGAAVTALVATIVATAFKVGWFFRVSRDSANRGLL